MPNHLHYGDNLTVLRDSIPAESVDLIYLDPPFNSNAGYNVLFKAPDGSGSAAQIEAFDDTWHWNDSAEAAFAEARNCVPHGPLVGSLLSTTSAPACSSASASPRASVDLPAPSMPSMAINRPPGMCSFVIALL